MERKIRVLLVDDEVQLVKNMARLLEFRGFGTAAVVDGGKALALLQGGSRFDVVVLDVKMPGMDGIAVLEKIKETRPEIEVIMLTGHASVESGVRAIRRGAYDYLMKPCDIEDLAEKIKEAHQAEEIRRHPVLWPRNFVKEITWHEFPRLRPDAGLVQALEAFCRDNDGQTVETLYLVDDRVQLAGVITRRDLLDAVHSISPEKSIGWAELVDRPGLLPDLTAGEIMQSPVMSVDAEMPLAEVAHLMITHNLRCIPVVVGKRMIGTARIQDIFQHVAHETE